MKLTIISKALFFISIIFLSTIISSCKKDINKEVASTTVSVTKGDPFFKLSLAQWSLNQYVELKKNHRFILLLRQKKWVLKD